MRGARLIKFPLPQVRIPLNVGWASGWFPITFPSKGDQILEDKPYVPEFN